MSGVFKDLTNKTLPLDRVGGKWVSSKTVAQIYPNEILEHIFLHLQQTDLASCANTCRNWMPTAYRVLYHVVVFKDGKYGREESRLRILMKNLMDSELIRGLVRHLHVKFIPECELSYDWLPLIPLDVVHTLNISYSLPRDYFTSYDIGRFEIFVETLLRSPFLSTIHSLGIWSPAWFDEPGARSHVLELTSRAANVESLALSLPTTDYPHESLLGLPYPELKHLTVFLSNHSPLLCDPLTATHQSLEHFRCEFRRTGGYELGPRMTETLQHFISPSIQTFYLYMDNDEAPSAPFFHVIPPSWSQLTELIVSRKVISSGIFLSLLSSLETLGWGSDNEGPPLELLSFLERASRNHPRFSLMMMFDFFEPSISVWFLQPMILACETNSIQLRIYRDSVTSLNGEIPYEWCLQDLLTSMEPSRIVK